MEIESKLSPADKDKFWELQVRNKDAKSFEELVTIKTHDRNELIKSLPNTPAFGALNINKVNEKLVNLGEDDDM
jgi:hypothetical protein